MSDEIAKTSELLNDLVNDKADNSKLQLGEINHYLHEKGFALLLILFSFPMAIPLPYPPGFTTILGIPLLFYAFQMIIGNKDPWLPKWVAKREIKVSHLKLAIAKSRKLFVFVEKFMKPRIPFLSTINGERIIGLLVFLCAISVALPIWFGNAIPSLGIFVMSLGLLNRDGVVIILGMVISIIGLFIASLVVVLGVKVFKAFIAKFFPSFNFGFINE